MSVNVADIYLKLLNIATLVQSTVNLDFIL